MNESDFRSKNLDYDVIIIGSGVGGLTAGNILSKEGYKVLIVEKHHIPGGYCTNFERKEFTFDASMHMINGCEPGGTIYEILKKIGVEDRIEFVKLEELFRWKDPKNEIDFHAKVNLSEFVEKLSEIFPEEESGIREFYQKYSKVPKHLLNFSNNDPSEEMLNLIDNLSDKTVSEIIDPYISNPDLKGIMTSLSGFFGLSPQKLNALMFLAGAMSYHHEGAYYVKGGSGTFSKTLANNFEEKGGDLSLLTEATRIIFEDGLATGIEVKDKKDNKIRYSADSIIANCDATHLVSDLCDCNSLPSEYREEVKSRRPSISTVILYLGLDVNVTDYGADDYEIWMPKQEEKKDELKEKILENPEEVEFPEGSVTAYSNVDPECCPSEKSVISTIYYADPEPFRRKLDEEGERGKEYRDFKEEISALIINRIEKVLDIPEFESHIEVKELATPLTLERYTYNREGAFIGWEMKSDQVIMNQLSQSTPVPNLFLCGQWTMLGGGVSAVMVSGKLVSQKVQNYL